MEEGETPQNVSIVFILFILYFDLAAAASGAGRAASAAAVFSCFDDAVDGICQTGKDHQGDYCRSQIHVLKASTLRLFRRLSGLTRK